MTRKENSFFICFGHIHYSFVKNKYDLRSKPSGKYKMYDSVFVMCKSRCYNHEQRKQHRRLFVENCQANGSHLSMQQLPFENSLSYELKKYFSSVCRSEDPY